MGKWWKHWVTRLWLTNHIGKVGWTVKDISGQSSHALVRRGRSVTAYSHAAPFTLRSHRKALCSRYFLFHPITVLLFPRSLSFVFVILSSRSVLLVEARQRDTGSTDRSGQVAVCYWGFRSDGWARLACRRCKQTPAPNAHASTPNHTTSASMPKCPSALSLCNACPVPSFSSCLLALFSQFCCSPQFLILFLFCYVPLSSTLPTLPLSDTGPLLTSPGLTITWEPAKSWPGNGTCHLHCEATHTHTHKHTKTNASPFWPFPSSLPFTCLSFGPVLLKYKADVVSVSPVDVDGDAGEWQALGSRMRLWQLRVDLQPWLSSAGRMWSITSENKDSFSWQI